MQLVIFVSYSNVYIVPAAVQRLVASFPLPWHFFTIMQLALTEVKFFVGAHRFFFIRLAYIPMDGVLFTEVPALSLPTCLRRTSSDFARSFIDVHHPEEMNLLFRVSRDHLQLEPDLNAHIA